MPIPPAFVVAIASEPAAAVDLTAAFAAFASALPDSAEILRSPGSIATWEAWEDLATGLSPVFLIDSALERVAQAGASAGLSIISKVLDDDARRLAAQWALANGPRLAGTATAKTDQAIRELISAALSGEESARTAARAMMNIRGFGLDPYRQGIVLRQIERWKEEGKSTRTVARRARKAYRRQLFRRAKDIWGFESRSATYEGARIGWLEAQRQGDLPVDARIIWRHPAGGDGQHPCPRCEALIGTAVGLAEDFRSPPVDGGGRKFNGKQLVRRRPPEHSRCDCFVEIE